MKQAVTIFFFLLFAPGCAETVTPVSRPPQADYSIDQEVDCFCAFGGKQVRLFIVSDSIAEAYWIATGVRLTAVERAPYRTIHQLNAQIRAWDTSSTFTLTVAYDSTYGYPSLVSLEPNPAMQIADVGVAYRTWNYVCLDRWDVFTGGIR